MFDNPKKELERLEQQLLAVDTSDEKAVFDEFDEDTAIHAFFAETDNIDAICEDLIFSARSAGFDTQEDSHVMDTNRYVAVPKKKRKGGWLLILCLAAALIAWRMGWFA